MRSLGLDVGGSRTGVAISDPQGILATPLTVLGSKDNNALIEQVLTLVEQHNVECVVVGLPRRLDGELGQQAAKVTAFADGLSYSARARNLDQIDIQLWDERFSTRAAERLRTDDGGASKLRRGARRGTRSHSFSIRAGVDAIAAAIILQSFLDSRQKDSEGA